jgi:hypothetical protein
MCWNHSRQWQDTEELNTRSSRNLIRWRKSRSACVNQHFHISPPVIVPPKKIRGPYFYLTDIICQFHPIFCAGGRLWALCPVISEPT